MALQNLRSSLLAVTLVLACACSDRTVGADTPPEGGTATSMPKLVLPEATHDFGKLRTGDEAKCTIPVRNEGPGTLVIEKVRSTCGCTVAKLEKDVLPTGEQTELKITLKASLSPGKLTKHITLSTNDP